MIARTARLIYGICNLECIKKITYNIVQTHNAEQTKLVKEQIKTIKLNSDFDEHENYNKTFAVNYKFNVSKEQQLRNHLMKQLMLVNLLITKRMIETDTLLEIIQQAKIGIIHPSLISIFGTDLPTDLEITNIYESVKLSDLTIYYADDNLVFIITLSLIY